MSASSCVVNSAPIDVELGCIWCFFQGIALLSMCNDQSEVFYNVPCRLGPSLKEKINEVVLILSTGQEL